MRSLASVFVLVFVLVTACNAGPSVEARLVECGLADDGEIGPRVSSAFYAPDACYRECLSSASCEELGDALCDASIELLQRCDARCAHHCANGALIARDLVCDGFSQCGDDSDEQGCPTFDCGDGTTVVAHAHCDGFFQCAGGVDEQGCGGSCPSRWGGGMLDVRYYRCDGVAQCADDADEAGCPVHRCTDGQAITHREDVSLRCDGWASCDDGSDERGCATLTPMCPMP